MSLRKEPLSSIIGGKVLSFRNLKYLSIIQMHMFSETIHLQNYSISSEKMLLLFSHCRVQLFATPWMAAHQALIFSTISQNLLKFMSTKSMMPSNHLIICRPILLLTSVFPSIRIFSNKLALHIRWPKYWSFSFSNRPSSEYSGLTSFRIEWFELLAVQGTLKSLLQHHSSKASVLQCSAFFMVQLSMGFSREEYWSRLPFLSPRDLTNPEIEPGSPALAGRFFTTERSEKPILIKLHMYINTKLHLRIS